jgi:hypothetical protein
MYRRLAVRSGRTLIFRLVRVVVVMAVAVVLDSTAARAAGIFGTMSNFDVFNDTTTNAYGGELELEGIHSADVTNTYPSHYNTKTVTEFSSGATFGTRITFTGYNFNPNGFIAPTIGQSTNGHFCVNIPGCEHFGFAVGTQPTNTRYFWLDQNSQRIGATPLAIPNPTWSYIPPVVPGNPPILQAVVQVPEPLEVEPQLPDSIWMKVYVTEFERPVNLDELISNGGVAPEGETEIETEWELLEGGVMSMAEVEVSEDAQAVVRRYEYFKYTGLYSDEHEPLSTWNGMGDPPAGERGAFISANMVAANLVPEPSALGLALVGLGVLAWTARRRLRA